MQPFELGVVDARAAIDAGRLTVGDYLASCLARTAAVEPGLHAFAHLDPDAVRRASGVAGGALAGIPVGIKDIIATADMPTQMGSAAFAGHVPDRSAWVVDRLRAASAVIFGKTVTTEFAWRHPGPTRNPWNPAHTPGGSSSGSTAAVAAGCVPVALGTQTLGSVLRPAAFCGIVGFKPSYGTIPRTGIYPAAESLDHVGVFARHVIDAALVASVLTGQDGADVTHVAPLAPAWPVSPSAAPPRIGWLQASVWDPVSDDQRDLMASVAARLAAAGAIVAPVTLPATFDALRQAALTISDTECAVVNQAFAAELPLRVSTTTAGLVARGLAIPASDYVRARRTQRDLIREFASWMTPFDAILMPPALGEAPQGLADTGDAMFCIPASLLGAPAITLPAGTGRQGLPLGIQLVQSWGRDRVLLETALWIERALAWPVRFPAGEGQCGGDAGSDAKAVT